MSSAPDVADESDAVLAFIRERQGDILAEAIASLESCSTDRLPAVVHAIHGTLGSYQLTEAHEAISALAHTLADPDTTSAQASTARDETVAALRELTTDAPTDGPAG